MNTQASDCKPDQSCMPSIKNWRVISDWLRLPERQASSSSWLQGVSLYLSSLPWTHTCSTFTCCFLVRNKTVQNPLKIPLWVGFLKGTRLCTVPVPAPLLTLTQYPQGYVNQPMFSHDLFNWYSQPMLRVLHNSYSSQHWLMLRFLLIWYVSWQSAHLVIPSASKEPSSCVWYDQWCTKLPIENLISLGSCNMQLPNSVYYIYVTSVYQSKWPVQWSLVH